MLDGEGDGADGVWSILKDCGDVVFFTVITTYVGFGTWLRAFWLYVRACSSSYRRFGADW